jgi:hypothetical protein
MDRAFILHPAAPSILAAQNSQLNFEDPLASCKLRLETS